MKEKGIVITGAKQPKPSFTEVEFVDKDGKSLGTVEIKDGKFTAPKGATAFRFKP